MLHSQIVMIGQGVPPFLASIQKDKNEQYVISKQNVGKALAKHWETLDYSAGDNIQLLAFTMRWMYKSSHPL